MLRQKIEAEGTQNTCTVKSLATLCVTISITLQLKESIYRLIQKNSEIKQFIEAAYRKNADDALVDCANYLEQSNYNAALRLPFTQILQFNSNPELYEQYELKDIELLFDSFIELLNEGFLDLHFDAANFADAVMDDKAKAKKLVDEGTSKLKVQLADLQQLSDSINAE